MRLREFILTDLLSLIIVSPEVNGMNTSEWIEAASEVLSDVDPETADPAGRCAVAMNELLRRFGARAAVAALFDAADAALDHCGEGNGTCDEPADEKTRRALDDVRGHLHLAHERLEARP